MNSQQINKQTHIQEKPKQKTRNSTFEGKGHLQSVRTTLGERWCCCGSWGVSEGECFKQENVLESHVVVIILGFDSILFMAVEMSKLISEMVSQQEQEHQRSQRPN